MRRFFLFLSLGLLVAACTPPNAEPPPAMVAQRADPLTQRLTSINAAVFDPKAATAPNAPDALLIRAEILMARARFSPGVIDGRAGSNLIHALKAYQTVRQLSPTGALDAQTWNALLSEPNARRPAVGPYVITAQDVAGPFAPDVGEDFVKLAALPQGPLYSTPLEALAERFHMSQILLTTLNPGVDFRTAGVRIIVADTAAPPLKKGDVAKIEVSKAGAAVLAYDHAGEVIAVYPATVGSTERPSPTGTHRINGVARNPDYIYDPAKLNWGPRSHGRFRIKPGPKNPVGVVWIDLNAPSYGIHGSPDPNLIGKTASHGCVRLTNWDVQALAAGVRPGVMVHFEGERAGG